MFTLIQGAFVYAPEFLGKKDILIAHDKIVGIGDNLNHLSLPDLKTVNAEGKLLLPGFIDSHVHITGGGGEGGFNTRTREICASELSGNGITTVVGVLGFDGVTRSLENLYAKAKSLEQEGISTYIYSGSYQVPVLTLTGSIQRDLVLIDKVVGVGEIAIADHRSFHPTADELSRIASEARVGGMAAGKRGVLHLHLGDHESGLELVFRVLKDSSIPITQFLPTHINRNRKLFKQSIEYGLSGGIVDITAGFESDESPDGCIPAYKALKQLLSSGVNENNISMSSDGNGSLPVFDTDGRLLRIDTASCSVLLTDLKKAVFDEGIPLEKALKAVTSNPAHILKIDQSKGRLKLGFDADMIITDDKLNIDSVLAKGNVLFESSK